MQGGRGREAWGEWRKTCILRGQGQVGGKHRAKLVEGLVKQTEESEVGLGREETRR